MTSEPIYMRLARNIRDQLGEPGTFLPSEAAIAAEYEANRSTIRRALAVLEAEGLITSGQGSRRQVRNVERWCWPMHEWEARENHHADADAWATSITSQGGEPKTEVSVGVVSADEQIARSLDVPVGSTVVVRDRVRSVNGEPHQLQASYFPKWLTDAHPEFLKPGDVAAPGGLLANAGVPQVRVFDAISARMPSADEAAALHMATGTPLIVHQRTGYDAQDRPVRFMVTRAAADRVEISYGLDCS